MTKVLDSFLFTHEFDMLELRLRTLWPVVDRFLLVEGDHNFANNPKKMQFDEQKNRFDWASEKLIHVQNIGKCQDHNGKITVAAELYVENQHRQFLYETTKKQHEFSDNDILLISDVDEIPSREVIIEMKNDSGWPQPLLLNQDFYYYNIKCHRGKRWHGTMAMRFSHKLGNIGEARAHRANMSKISKECGWHFAHFFDEKGIKEKLFHSSHRGYYSEKYYNSEYLRECIRENKNFLKKHDGNSSPEVLPEYLIDELKRFPLFTGNHNV